MNPDKKPRIDEERRECDLQILPMKQTLKDAEEILNQYDSDYKRLGE